MDIYIKSFNRPFLLDKCLASIQMFAENFNGKIVVMDDGTPEKYLQKIQGKYPEIELHKSEFYQEKSKAIENNLDPEKNIPAVFWRETISKGSDYFVLIEDDCWFSEPIDFVSLENDMKLNNLHLVKLLWMGNKALISDRISKSTTFLHITKPKLFSWNPFIIELLYRKKTFKIDAVLNRLGVPIVNNYLKYYQIYAVANAAFSKEYYLRAWGSTTNKVDELEQILQVVQITKQQLNVANAKIEPIRTSLKTTASKQNKESLNFDFDVYSINKILNEAWFSNKFEVFDFKNDISNSFIEKIIEQNNFPENSFSNWLIWYNKLKQSYENIGCVIENDR
nr:hypothetical protein [uncultured Flavobacterium sp.]